MAAANQRESASAIPSNVARLNGADPTCDVVPVDHEPAPFSNLIASGSVPQRPDRTRGWSAGPARTGSSDQGLLAGNRVRPLEPGSYDSCIKRELWTAHRPRQVGDAGCGQRPVTRPLLIPSSAATFRVIVVWRW